MAWQLGGLILVSAMEAADVSVGAYVTGSELKDAFASGDKARTEAAHAYVMGAIDMHMTAYAAGSKGIPKLCPPAGSGSDQASAVVEKYLREHPEDWHYAAASIVFSAVYGAWSCTD